MTYASVLPSFLGNYKYINIYGYPLMLRVLNSMAFFKNNILPNTFVGKNFRICRGELHWAL